jgi:hypothetical protein
VSYDLKPGQLYYIDTGAIENLSRELAAAEARCVVLESERDRYRERLDQYEAYAITVKSALDDRERVRVLEAALREIAGDDVGRCCFCEYLAGHSKTCPVSIARAALGGEE